MLSKRSFGCGVFRGFYNLSQGEGFLKQRFTLIELLVAIGIIAVLASLIGPSLVKGQDASLQSACLSNLKSVGIEDTRIRLLKNPIYPNPIDPFLYGGNAQANRSFFDQVQFLPAHYIEPPVFPEIGGGSEGGGGSSGEGSEGGSSGGAKISAVDFLTLLQLGCPSVEPNPLFGVDEKAPEYRSYSYLGDNAGKDYRQAWPWILSESHFTTIESSDQLAKDRHEGKVNVYFKDGHVEVSSVGDVEFP
jgi:prepilin-type N-terminal cleavage/methylation domain-containing protein/prepilin-type processing-associated H-X9-DG protein